jgi:hypothetical protein
MGDDAAGVSRLDALIDRSQLPLLYRNEILNCLLDDPGFRAIESSRNCRDTIVQVRVEADADWRGFAH